MIGEYEHEPIRGLPGDLPEGEHIIWQGAPDWWLLARSAFHVRLVAAYFAILVLAGLAGGSLVGLVATIAAGLIGTGLIMLFAWGVARTSVYTLTNKRLVLRIGVALTKCINLPLSRIGGADLRTFRDGAGEIALRPTGKHRLGYAILWPHARPMKLKHPQPMLRALPDAQSVADKLARAAAAIQPIERGESAGAQETGPAPAQRIAA